MFIFSTVQTAAEPRDVVVADGQADEAEPIDDALLVNRCLAELPENTTSYQKLVVRHYSFAYHLGLRVLGNSEDAEEIAQDAMLQVFHHLASFQGRSTFRTWLYAIVMNAARNHLAKIHTRRTAEASLADEASVTAASVSVPADRIQDTLELLDAEQREIVIMRHVSGLSLEEISDALQIGLSAAKVRLYRAMDAFKSAWDKCDRVNSLKSNPLSRRES